MSSSMHWRSISASVVPRPVLLLAASLRPRKAASSTAMLGLQCSVKSSFPSPWAWLVDLRGTLRVERRRMARHSGVSSTRAASPAPWPGSSGGRRQKLALPRLAPASGQGTRLPRPNGASRPCHVSTPAPIIHARRLRQRRADARRGPPIMPARRCPHAERCAKLPYSCFFLHPLPTFTFSSNLVTIAALSSCKICFLWAPFATPMPKNNNFCSYL